MKYKAYSDSYIYGRCKWRYEDEVLKLIESGFYKNEILSPEEQELQDTMDKLSNEIYSQCGIPKWKDESAVKMAINAYDTFIQNNFKEGK